MLPDFDAQNCYSVLTTFMKVIEPCALPRPYSLFRLYKSFHSLAVFIFCLLRNCEPRQAGSTSWSSASPEIPRNLGKTIIYSSKILLKQVQIGHSNCCYPMG